MTASRSLVAPLCLALALPQVVWTRSAAAQVETAGAPLSQTLQGEAKAAYEAAKVLLADGDPAGAYSKFKQSYELSLDPRLLWNMAACEKQRRRYHSTQQLIELYVKESGPSLSSDELARAKETLDLVKTFVGRLKLDVNPAGANIVVDGYVVGRSPLREPVALDMGLHVVRVELAGYAPLESKIEIKGGQQGELSVKLRAENLVAQLSVSAGRGNRIDVDGRHVGIGRWSGNVAAGLHRVRVTAPGKSEFSSIVELPGGSSRTISVALAAESSGAWWPWAVGIAAAGAAAAGGYFLLRPDAEREPQQPGTLDPGSVFLSP